MDIEKVLQSLRQRKRNIRCNELIEGLEKLGFTVRDGKRGGHKLFMHPELADFHGGSFNCDHGKNPQIKPVYVSNIIKLLEQYQEALTALKE